MDKEDIKLFERCFNNNKKLVDNYFNHKVFSVIKNCCESYNSLGYSSFGSVKSGTNILFGIDHKIFESLKGTLNSISLLLKERYINDGYALIRKYLEGVVLDIYKNEFLENNFKPEDSLYVKKINKWSKGEGSFPEYLEMLKYIQKSKKIKKVLNYYDTTKEGDYITIKQECNKNMHYNSLDYMLLNNPDLFTKHGEKHLDYICDSIIKIFELHWATLFIFHPEYMVSSDYMDNLDCGLEPIENSQYWISPFAEELFHKLWDDNIEIANVIKENTYLVLSKEE
ncbi:hypothetical protein E0494_04605 [Marinilabiliaceae bacterium JC040]|nr:hypothetical protein [Marinilabiliaceae bacterium JC040]